jgi:hypothetical protein
MFEMAINHMGFRNRAQISSEQRAKAIYNVITICGCNLEM